MQTKLVLASCAGNMDVKLSCSKADTAEQRTKEVSLNIPVDVVWSVLMEDQFLAPIRSMKGLFSEQKRL